MQSHIRHLSGIDPEIDELAAEAVEDAASEGAPLLGNRSAESIDEESIDTIRPSGPRSNSP